MAKQWMGVSATVVDILAGLHEAAAGLYMAALIRSAKEGLNGRVPFAWIDEDYARLEVFLVDEGLWRYGKTGTPDGWYEIVRFADLARFGGCGPRPAISADLRRRVIERDGYVCQLCGGPVHPSDLHLDHRRPHSLGGVTEEHNLQVSHSFCNISKGNRI